MLVQCTTLTELDLSFNDIDDAGTESLSRVMAQCPALAHLHLDYNEIGPAGAESLAGVIRENPNCTILPLDSRNQESAQIPGFWNPMVKWCNWDFL